MATLRSASTMFASTMFASTMRRASYRCWQCQSKVARPGLQARWLSQRAAAERRRVEYGFVGLGQMGFNMARNLRAKMQTTDLLKIYDIDANSTKCFVDEMSAEDAKRPAGKGATVRIVATEVEAARNSHILHTVLPSTSHVQDVYNAIAAAADPSSDRSPDMPTRFFLDHSTIDPLASRAIADLVFQTPHLHSTFIDAPMSGGVHGAHAGTLTFMLGCETHLLAQLTAHLSSMGARTLHCGPQGNGLAAKLANNYLLGIMNIAVAEALNLGQRWGLDARRLSAIINASTGRCWPSEVNNPVPGVVPGAPAGRDYVGGFATALMRKDLHLAIRAAAHVGAHLRLKDVVQQTYADVESDELLRGRDFSVVYKLLAREGVEEGERGRGKGEGGEEGEGDAESVMSAKTESER